MNLTASVGNDSPGYGHRRNASKSSTASSLRHVRHLSTKSTARSSIASLVPFTQSASTSYSTPRSSVGYATSLSDLAEGNPEIEQHGHTHWCHECDKHVNTCDGWKRHMKEHEISYPCMPMGSVEHTADGPKCAFCSIENPDHDHLAGYQMSLCSTTKGAARKSRKSLMVDHLALHGVHDTAALDLADKWQCTRNRRAFACGFCVKGFRTLIEQLHHIDNEHFKNGQGKSEWDTNKVIKGLLRQPKVIRFWQKLLATDIPLLEDRFIWEPPAAETLQSRLGTGNESGADLALTAFGLSVYDSRPLFHDVSPTITHSLLLHMATDSVMIAAHQHGKTHKYPTMSSSPNPADTAEQHGAPNSHYHPGIPIWSESHVSEHNLARDQGKLFPFHPSLSNGHESNFLGDPSSSLQGPFFDNDNFQVEAQSLLYQYTSEQVFLNPGPELDQHAQLQGHLNNSGDLVAPQLRIPEIDLAALFADPDIIIPPCQMELTSPTSPEHTNSLTTPTATWNVDGTMARGPGPTSREKPLPALPVSQGKATEQAVDTRPRSPMDTAVN